MLLDKVPPYSEEAEQALLGGMILDRNILTQTLPLVREEDFYKADHRVVFHAISELYEKGDPIDLVTVTERLRVGDKLDAMGGPAYLVDLMSALPIYSIANTQRYAKIVVEKSLLRRLIQASMEIIESGYAAEQDVREIIDEAEGKIFAIAQKNERGGFVALREVVDSAFAELERMAASQGGITGIPSGFTDLDRRTLGFQRSDMIIVAARPGMGKTSFALNVALRAALKHQHHVAIFSLEMSKEQLALRMLSTEAMVPMQRIRAADLDQEEWDRLAYYAGKIARAPVYISDTPAVSVLEIRAECRRLKARHGLDMIIIDYIGLMQSHGRRTENRQQEISEISRSLKMLARELDVPVVALSQLSRAVENRPDHRPQLSDLRESGALEQDADIVTFIYRDEVYNKQTEDLNIAEVIVAKFRNGATGSFKLTFQKEYTRFDNYTGEPEE